MQKLIPLCTVFLALGLAGSATAFAAKTAGPKAGVMEKYDADKNGKLDAGEIAVLRKDYAAAPDDALLKRFDKDGDGKLSDKEIAQMIPGSGSKSEKSGKSGVKEKQPKDEKEKDKKSGKEGKPEKAGKNTKAKKAQEKTGGADSK